LAFGPAPSASCARSLLVLTSEYAPYTWGGLGTYLHHALPLVAASGVEVDVVVSPTYAAEFPDVGHEVPQIESLCVIDSRLAQTRQLEMFDSYARSWYDSVFIQDASLAHIAVALRRQGRCERVVAAAHLPSYSGFSYFDRPLEDVQAQAEEALLFRHSDVVVVPSAFAADILLRVHRLSRAEIRVIPLAAPVSQRTHAHSVAGPMRVCVVGRLAKQKGLAQLCEVLDATPGHVARFTHIGRELDQRDRLLFESRPLEMLGQVAHRVVLERLLQADVLLSTSLHETFGLAVLEAMACGAVPVAFNCGALPELIEDEVDGFLLSVGDSHGMVRVLGELARCRETLERCRMAAVAKARRYGWQAHVDDLILQLFPNEHRCPSRNRLVFPPADHRVGHRGPGPRSQLAATNAEAAP
jgi:glycosyltransferase involved in cell wall biosynthesis